MRDDVKNQISVINSKIEEIEKEIVSWSDENGELLLGTWQGIYLFEHRLNPQTRTIIHHFLGEV